MSYNTKTKKIYNKFHNYWVDILLLNYHMGLSLKSLYYSHQQLTTLKVVKSIEITLLFASTTYYLESCKICYNI